MFLAVYILAVYSMDMVHVRTIKLKNLKYWLAWSPKSNCEGACKGAARVPG